MSREYQFTSESVSEGHPDKLADQISDAILDAALTETAAADRHQVRCACETLLKDRLLALAGEMRLADGISIDPLQIAERVIREVGYQDAADGMDLQNAQRINAISPQSQDISQGIDAGTDKQLGAGDQGMMFGYACRESDAALMPAPIMIAHDLVRRQAQVRRQSTAGSALRPDAKSQVTVRYADGKPAAIDKIVLSTQHAADIDGKEVVDNDERIRQLVIDEIIKPVLAQHSGLDCTSDNILVNPTGKFLIGGPLGDAGLTGRKIIVDTYGGAAPHGGGAFSGKDPTKVDRSAAYAARNIAKNVVAAGAAERCLVQLSYAIGVSQPVSVMVETFGTAAAGTDNELIEKKIRAVYDLSPAGIIERFSLWQPIYRQTAAYGHFGRTDIELPWESTAAAEELKQA
ncbi:MAG: methionine adenosyltransferase [Betaproteobacteria bacterium]|nr:methionine adenosyltransferase [Betaproteobacteria bacterium]